MKGKSPKQLKSYFLLRKKNLTLVTFMLGAFPNVDVHFAKPIDMAKMYQTICKYAESNCTNCRKQSKKNGTP